MNTIRINDNGSIELDGNNTGLRVAQMDYETIVYACGEYGQGYREIRMPMKRYTLANTTSTARHGLVRFASDLREVLSVA